VQSAIQIKSDKNNFICIQSADKERFMTLHHQMSHNAIVTVSKSCTHSSFNIAVTL